MKSRPQRKILRKSIVGATGHDLCQVFWQSMSVCVYVCMYVYVLTAVGLAACACVGKLDAMLVHTPTDTHRVVALCGLVESLNIAVRCVGA